MALTEHIMKLDEIEVLRWMRRQIRLLDHLEKGCAYSIFSIRLLYHIEFCLGLL